MCHSLLWREDTIKTKKGSTGNSDIIGFILDAEVLHFNLTRCKMWVGIRTKLRLIAKPSVLPRPKGCSVREMGMKNLIVVTEKMFFSLVKNLPIIRVRFVYFCKVRAVAN